MSTTPHPRGPTPTTRVTTSTTRNAVTAEMEVHSLTGAGAGEAISH